MDPFYFFFSLIRAYFFLIFFLWLASCLILAKAARSKGLNPIGYFFMAVFMTPLFAALALIAHYPDLESINRQRLANALYNACPYCGQAILIKALKCPYCHSETEAQSTAQPTAFQVPPSP